MVFALVGLDHTTMIEVVWFDYFLVALFFSLGIVGSRTRRCVMFNEGFYGV